MNRLAVLTLCLGLTTTACRVTGQSARPAGIGQARPAFPDDLHQLLHGSQRKLKAIEPSLPSKGGGPRQPARLLLVERYVDDTVVES